MRNIDWKAVPFEEVDFKGWNDVISMLRGWNYSCSFITRNSNSQMKITSVPKLLNSYFIQAIRNNHYAILFFFDIEKECFRKLRFSTRPNVEAEITITGMGSIAYRTMSKEFLNNNKTAETFVKAFNGNNGHYRRAIKNCVPAPITFCKELIVKFFYSNNFYKADVSSCFPYEASKTLPDLSKAILKDGRVEPSKEYPFAFYLNSHHIKIYNELDTRELLKSKFYNPSVMIDGTQRYKNVSDEDEKTLLLPVSKYTLKKELEKFYEIRKIDANAKLIMNSFIGYLQGNASPIAPQISAVVIARSIARQIKYAEIIEKKGNEVILINTDSVGWIGDAVPEIIDKDKFMGANNLEHANAEICLMGVKKYQIKDGEIVKTVISGVSKTITEKMKFLEIINDKNIVSNDTWEFYVEDDGTLVKRKVFNI